MEKYPDGSSVFRSVRAEERAAAEFSKAKQKRMEMLYSQIQKKFEEKKIKGRFSYDPGTWLYCPYLKGI